MIRSLIIALAFTLVSVTAFAADTATVDVTASVTPTCNFGAASYPMTFGAIDPTGTGDITATATVDFTCNTAAPTLTGDTGARTMAGPGAGLDYTVSAYSAAAVSGTQSVNIVGTIVDTVYQVALAGAYTDTLSLLITP